MTLFGDALISSLLRSKVMGVMAIPLNDLPLSNYHQRVDCNYGRDLRGENQGKTANLTELISFR